MVVREVGLFGHPNPYAFQGASSCLPLSLLRNALLHHASLRLLVRTLLQRPIPTEEHTRAALARLEAVAKPIDWPLPETSYDDDLLASVTVLFLQPARASRAKRALRSALGGEKF